MAQFSDAVYHYAFDCGQRYWPRAEHAISRLDVPRCRRISAGELAAVKLPDWAADLGVGKPAVLLVDSSTVPTGDGPAYARCDWWAAAFLHVSGACERAKEAVQGPCHSYAARLRGIDGRLFERAWANRIYLFLRRAAARKAKRSEDALFGPLPPAEIQLTHDVDAVRKTAEIRVKQSIFHAYNALRMTVRGQVGPAAAKVAAAVSFLHGGADYWQFGLVREMEERNDLRSTFNFYAGPAGLRRGPRALLFDPAYDVGQLRLREEIRSLLEGGWQVGLHPAFASWWDPARIRRERKTLEQAAEREVTVCRQHWLRFSWAKTWLAQEAAGLKLDMTLGFNDRPGFRNGAALSIHPWNASAERPHAIRMLPMVFMDAHFYDYAQMGGAERKAALEHWIGEVKAVHGEASVNWHVHTLAEDYGWAEGFRELVSILAGKR